MSALFGIFLTEVKGFLELRQGLRAVFFCDLNKLLTMSVQCCRAAASNGLSFRRVALNRIRFEKGAVLLMFDKVARSSTAQAKLPIGVQLKQRSYSLGLMSIRISMT
jgi:hypothetical protein